MFENAKVTISLEDLDTLRSSHNELIDLKRKMSSSVEAYNSIDNNNLLKCPVCGETLELNIAFTGADWECEAGEGSGYDWPLSLRCNKVECRRIYTLGHLKKQSDFSVVIEKYKCFK